MAERVRPLLAEGRDVANCKWVADQLDLQEQERISQMLPPAGPTEEETEMKTHGWFGQSWGAPCCEPEDHVPTPIGSPCLRCREPIREGDQGLVQPHIRDCGGQWIGTIEPTHLDCYLRTIRKHGAECPRCRGKKPSEHAPGCRRNETGLCSCTPIPEAG